MSTDKYYTAVYLKIIYADENGATKKYYHRIESTKLVHYFLPDQVPSSYQDPIWRKLRDQCKARRNKVVFSNFKFVGEPETEAFYLKHIMEATKELSATHKIAKLHEIIAKMYPWSDICDADTIKKDPTLGHYVVIAAAN